MGSFSNTEVDLAPAEVYRRMQEEDLVLIDVRESYEWEAGHVPGSRHVEIERAASSAPSIPDDRQVAFLCLGGVRSAMVAHGFRAIGIDAWSVVGGFAAWVDAGLPIEPADGRVAPH